MLQLFFAARPPEVDGEQDTYRNDFGDAGNDTIAHFDDRIQGAVLADLASHCHRAPPPHLRKTSPGHPSLREAVGNNITPPLEVSSTVADLYPLGLDVPHSPLWNTNAGVIDMGRGFWRTAGSLNSWRVDGLPTRGTQSLEFPGAGSH